MALSFGLAKAGFADGTLETTAKVALDKDGDGFKVTRSDLTLKASVPGIDEARFAEIARGAEKNCPISKVLNAEISLDYQLNGSRTTIDNCFRGGERQVFLRFTSHGLGYASCCSVETKELEHAYVDSRRDSVSR